MVHSQAWEEKALNVHGDLLAAPVTECWKRLFCLGVFLDVDEILLSIFGIVVAKHPFLGAVRDVAFPVMPGLGIYDPAVS